MKKPLTIGEKIVFAGLFILFVELVEACNTTKPARKRYRDNVINFTRYKEGKEALSRIAETFSNNDPA